MKLKNSSKKSLTASTKAAPTSPAPAPVDGGSSTVFVQQPPKDAKIPSAPSGFVPTPGTDNRGLQPKKAHLAAMPDALDELDRFTDYDKVFGMTAPPLENTKQTLGAAGAWSSQRAQMRSWDLYCRTQEGLAWREARGLIDRMSPAFSLATATDSTVAQRYPGLARLFGASKQIGQRAANTRKANKQLKAEGKAPTKGAAAKRKQKEQEKALLGAANAQAAQAVQGAAATQSPTQVQAAPVAPVAPVVSVAAPISAPSAVGASAPPPSAPVAGAQVAPAAVGGGVGH